MATGTLKFIGFALGMWTTAVMGQVPSSDADVIARVIVPATALQTLVEGGCSTALETKWAGAAADQQLERDLPGIHAAMGEAARQSCEASIRPALAAERAKVIRDWESRTTSAQRARLAVLIRPFLPDLDRPTAFTMGGTTLEAAKRGNVASGSSDRRWDAAATKFRAQADGSRLLAMLLGDQRQESTVVQGSQGPVVAAIMKSLSAAHEAANDFARAKGYGPIYAASSR